MAATTLFACRADNPLQAHRPSAYVLLPDSEPTRGHGAIIGRVLDSATREPLPGWGVTLNWSDDPTPPHVPKLSWVTDDTIGGFGVYGLIPNTKGYRIKCVAPNSRTIWTGRLRITSGAVDTVTCLMQPSDPRKPEGKWENWTPC